MKIRSSSCPRIDHRELQFYLVAAGLTRWRADVGQLEMREHIGLFQSMEKLALRLVARGTNRKLDASIIVLIKEAPSSSFAFSGSEKKRSSFSRWAVSASISFETLALSVRNAVSAIQRTYTCQASARQPAAATTPRRAENTRKRRCLSSGSVARLTLSIIVAEFGERNGHSIQARYHIQPSSPSSSRSAKRWAGSGTRPLLMADCKRELTGQ